jgi:hypothetical protein
VKLVFSPENKDLVEDPRVLQKHDSKNRSKIRSFAKYCYDKKKTVTYRVCSIEHRQEIIQKFSWNS